MSFNCFPSSPVWQRWINSLILTPDSLAVILTNSVSYGTEVRDIIGFYPFEKCQDKIFARKDIDILFQLWWRDTSMFIKKLRIVRALWLTERRVCSSIYNYSCDIKLFCSVHALFTQACSRNLDKLVTLFTQFLVGWNVKNPYKHAVSIWFCLS